MHTLDLIVQPHLDPHLSLAEDHHFLHAVGHPSRTRIGVLRVYEFDGTVLSLGRYHLAPAAAAPNGGVRLHRRHSGGRAAPCGEGFIGVALVLPHRAALFSADPLALAPSQVMNRYARGIMDALRIAGIEPLYPGRDFLTVRRRVVALVSFEVAASGALLFEAIIANRNDFSTLPQLLDRADPGGVVKAEMLIPEQTTSLSRELGTPLSTEEIGELLRRGYEQQFGLRCVPHSIAALEEHAVAAAVHEFHDERWLFRRQPRPDLDHHAVARTQLGMFEVFLALEQDRFIKDLTLAGDFIANSPAIESLERELRLCPAEREAIDTVVATIFAQPENFILGVGPVSTVVDTITRGLAR